jgi:hypothetical protein
MNSTALVPVVRSYGDAPLPATQGDNSALILLLLIVGFLALSRGGGMRRWD